jgi:basic membrane lipoprotein Med (substrate-binding protein (PBP1-ABC) superfamily)/DNA-binding SARP family transcriptional activator
VKFGILGPLVIDDAGRSIDVGSRRQRALLSLLLLHPGRVVSSDHILDALWGDDAVGKENAMWVAVSRLRTALGQMSDASGEALLVTRDHGYQLAIDPLAIDAVRFEQLVVEARSLVEPSPAVASDRLGQALALWRGAAIEEFCHEAFAGAAAVRFEQLRTEAVELRADAELRLGHGQDQIGILEDLWAREPYRERTVELLMRCLYHAGRQADALRTFVRFRRVLADDLGIEPPPELRRVEEQILLHDPALQRARTEGTSGRRVASPFKGLHAFGEDDAEDFFGRDRLVSVVLRRIADGRRLVVLVGASGSGKSSVARAGVIPAIRKGANDSSENWIVAQMVPGAHPLAELEAALLRSSLDAPDSLAEVLGSSPLGLLRAALRILPERARLLLVLDQFEELFTLVSDEAERTAFLDLLGPALDDPHGRIVVVATLRADLYDRPLGYPDLANRLNESIVNVSGLTPDELEEAAQGPMRRAGVAFEPAVLASVITEVIGRPGALPLFQFTLTTLFDRRVGDSVTMEQYRQMGGLRAALSQRAEDVFGALDEVEQAAARQLLLRMVAITGDGDWTRRRVPGSELVALGSDVVALQGAIDALSASRLLTFDRDQVSGSPTVEVAHEALMTEWPRLQRWIADAGDDLRRHASFASAMREWEASDRSDDYLLVGGRLIDYETWSTSTLLDLNGPEVDFLQRSVTSRDLADRDGADRHTVEDLRSKRRRRRTFAAVAGVFALITAGVTWTVISRSADRPSIAWVRGPELIDSSGRSSIDTQVRNGWQLAQRRFDFIVVDIQFADIADDLALANPTARFVFAGNENTQRTDIANLTGATADSADGSFLAGAAAALTSETGVIGFVGATPTVVDDFRVGYEAGARWAVPDIEVLSSYLDTPVDWGQVFIRPDLGAFAARGLYLAGADVVYHAAGGSGDQLPALATEMSDELGRYLWMIGVDVDQALAVSGAARDHVLTSMIKRSDLAITTAIERYLAGELEPGLLSVGLADGAIDWSDTGGHLDDEVVARLQEASDLVRSGEIVVPRQAASPPTSLPEPAAVIDVTWTAAGCEIVEPVGVTSGDRIRLELVNDTPEVQSAALFAGDGAGEEWLVLGLDALPGGSNAGVAVVTTDSAFPAQWRIGCDRSATAEPETSSALDVAMVSDADALGRVSFDGESCHLDGDDTVLFDEHANYTMTNTSTDPVTMAWGHIADGASIAEVRADWQLMWDGININGLWLEPGQSTTVNMHLGAPGSYAVNCFSGEFSFDGGNYPAAVLTVTEPEV